MSLHTRLRKLEHNLTHASIREALTSYHTTGNLPKANPKVAEICLRVTAAITAMAALRKSDYS